MQRKNANILHACIVRRCARGADSDQRWMVNAMTFDEMLFALMELDCCQSLPMPCATSQCMRIKRWDALHCTSEHMAELAEKPYDRSARSQRYKHSEKRSSECWQIVSKILRNVSRAHSQAFQLAFLGNLLWALPSRRHHIIGLNYCNIFGSDIFVLRPCQNRNCRFCCRCSMAHRLHLPRIIMFAHSRYHNRLCSNLNVCDAAP